MSELCITEKELIDGARSFEHFWLRPKKMAGETAVLRMKITTKWGGWKLKDELVASMGLEVGDTINAEISVLNAPGLIRDDDDTDLFASGEGADWLLDNDVGYGSVIEGKVRFVYTKAPVGREDKEIWTIKLVFIEGYRVVEGRNLEEEKPNNGRTEFVWPF